MKDSIAFAKGILDLTKSGELKWKKNGEQECTMFFLALHEGNRITFQRILCIDTPAKAITYRLASNTGESLCIYKCEDLYINSVENEGFNILDTLGRLIDPETDVPVIKTTLSAFIQGWVDYCCSKD